MSLLDEVMAWSLKSAELIMTILLAAILIFPCQAQSMNIIGNVNPNPGKEDSDFTYSATIDLGAAAGTSALSGPIRIDLGLYNGEKLLKSYSQKGKFPGGGISPQEMIKGKSEPFLFGPYNFVRDFSLKSVDDLSYEFTLYSGPGDGTEVAKNRNIGPQISYPYFAGLQYNTRPYYVQPLEIAATFKDNADLFPSAQIDFQGPLHSSREKKWTSDLQMKASGTTYVFSSEEDISNYVNGGNFSFNLTFNDAQASPITVGPNYFTVLPYKPRIESIDVQDKIESGNFSIKAYVEDTGKKLEGDDLPGSNATIIIAHPEKPSQAYKINSIRPVVVEKGRKELILFEWNEKDIPFSRNDVEISKKAPFQATVIYSNDNWNYNASKISRAFYVINETPTLSLQYNKTVFVRRGENVTQYIKAIVKYSKGKGILRLSLDGWKMHLDEPNSGIDLGDSRYMYVWPLSFNETNINNNYSFNLTYLHPTLDGGKFMFSPPPDPIVVQPIAVDFKNSSVIPSTGRWNDTYTYTTSVNSSQSGVVALQIYNPCSRRWEKSDKLYRISSGETRLNWTLKPFRQECSNMKDDQPMYSFIATLDTDYPSYEFPGPSIVPDMPRVIAHSVTPEQGLHNATFNYSVTISFANAAPIELQIFNPLHNQYESKEIRDYTKAGQNETLIWQETFPSDWQGRDLTYKFRYSGYDLVTDKGPQIFPEEGLPKIQSAFVAPMNGTYNSVFLYETQLEFDKNADINLLIFNPIHNQYESMGMATQTYDRPGENQTLSWQKSFSSEFEGQNLTFKFVYQGKDLGIFFGPNIEGKNPKQVSPNPNNVSGTNSTKPPSSEGNAGNLSDNEFLDLVRKYHIGGGGGVSQDRFNSMLNQVPTDKIPKWPGSNGSAKQDLFEPPAIVSTRVVPEIGNWSDEFTYEATIQNRNESLYTLGLDVYLPGSNSWESQEDKDVLRSMYNKVNHTAKVSWRYQKFTPDDVGNSSRFRIFYYDQSNNKQRLTESIGPKNITKQDIRLEGDVTPENGSISGYYTYTINATNAAKSRMKIGLEIFLPGTKDWYPLGEKWIYPSRYDENRTATVSWNVKPFTLDDANMTSKYRVYYEDDKQNTGEQELNGPNLVNHNPRILEISVDPINGTSREGFTYHAKVFDADGDDLSASMTLYDPEKQAPLSTMSQGVLGIKAKNINGSDLTWPYKFAETYANKTFSYSLIVSDGVAATSSGNKSGPEILALPTITVDLLPLESQNNNWWDKYKLSVRVDNPSPMSSYFTPRVLTSRGWMTLESKAVSQTSGPEQLDWPFQGFVVEDQNQPIQYEIKYTLPDQFGRFGRSAMEPPISDVMMERTYVLLNMIWILLLGCLAYVFGGKILLRLFKEAKA